MLKDHPHVTNVRCRDSVIDVETNLEPNRSGGDYLRLVRYLKHMTQNDFCDAKSFNIITKRNH